MEVFCKKAILKTKMGSFFKKATVLRNICEPLSLSLSLSLSHYSFRKKDTNARTFFLWI